MKPLMCGYMRFATSDVARARVERIRRELSEFAVREVFTLGDVFTECLMNSDSAFYVLIEKVKCYEVKNVVISSLWHFARMSGLQDAMRQRISLETGTHIWVAEGVWE
ncbi:hypothetical protein HFP72_01585 [Nocardiopsis sp. ARC36]